MGWTPFSGLLCYFSFSTWSIRMAFGNAFDSNDSRVSLRLQSLGFSQTARLEQLFSGFIQVICVWPIIWIYWIFIEFHKMLFSFSWPHGYQDRRRFSWNAFLCTVTGCDQWHQIHIWVGYIKPNDRWLNLIVCNFIVSIFLLRLLSSYKIGGISWQQNRKRPSWVRSSSSFDHRILSKSLASILSPECRSKPTDNIARLFSSNKFKSFSAKDQTWNLNSFSSGSSHTKFGIAAILLPGLFQAQSTSRRQMTEIPQFQRVQLRSFQVWVQTLWTFELGKLQTGALKLCRRNSKFEFRTSELGRF